MRFWAVFWALIGTAIGAFTWANWQVLTARTAVDFGVAQFTAPLGLALLGAMAALALFFLLFLVWIETTALIQLGRANRRATVEPAAATMDEFRLDLERSMSARLEQVEQVVKDAVTRLEHLKQTG